MYYFNLDRMNNKIFSLFFFFKAHFSTDKNAAWHITNTFHVYSTVLILFGNNSVFSENKNSFEDVTKIHVILNDNKNCDDNMDV